MTPAVSEPVIEREYRLTPGQERLWFLHRFDPEDTSYHMYSRLRLRGELDLPALRRALDALAARHQPLRTRYQERDGVAVGQVLAPAPCPLELLECAPERADELVRERLERPLDLAAAPPLRPTLLRIGPQEHQLALVLHHIAADGWSMDVYHRELAELYNGVQLPPLPLEFHSHAEQSRERAAADREFWQRTLHGSAPLDLPPTGTDTRGAFHQVPLPAGLAGRLHALARAERSTVFLVLLSAFQALLSRHHPTTDLSVGTPVAGRDRVELEPLIGYFSTTLVVRQDLSGSPSLRELLKRNRRTFFEAYAHPQVPFEELGAGSEGPFQALLVLNGGGAGGGEAGFDGLAVDHLPSGFARAKAPLTLDAWDDPADPEQGLGLSLGHRLSLLDHAGGARLAARLGTLLAAALADPDRPLDRLELLPATERTALLAAGRGPRPAGPARAPHLLFAEQAAADPTAEALVDGERRFSYAELADLVTKTTERLDGLAPGQVLAVSLPRSAELVAALLAAHRRGAAYTYLDPADPAERRARLAAGAGAALLLDATGLHPLPGARPGPAGLAYLCHTSGSTGEPKAVQLTAEGLAVRVRWMVERYGLGPGERVLQFASASFDAHVEEVFPALAAGATLVLLPGGGELLPDFLRTPEGRRLTVLDLPTSYWHALTAEPATAWPPELRLLILGGEQARGAAVHAWRRAVGPKVRLLNTYGPTEATVIATAAEVADGPADPPIGQPLDCTDAYVLDEHRQLVPFGVAGQLHLGGPGVALGYAGDPERTARAFHPDPFGDPGDRLYATGDRVLRTPDGRLHFLGRLDGQLKVRGHRIEPGEVERHLLAEPGVLAAAVAVRDQALVAYLVGALPDPAALRARLPERLVPGRFVLLEALPLTPGGKVDRAALPDPGRPDPGAAKFLAPRDDAERLVAAVWQEVLDLPAVGALDDFFALGGHSLHALRVTARLGEATALDLPVRLVFDHRSVAALAAEVRALVLADLSLDAAAEGS
ncbi:condensation domain-containing protein [Kitasatospora sp. NPDC006697]|uniref:condensation domain-containing protein n=1 Tax=Kitasatospora sp. NPDC006697 TaxID=3364020 RepID=UPI0036AEA344